MIMQEHLLLLCVKTQKVIPTLTAKIVSEFMLVLLGFSPQSLFSRKCKTLSENIHNKE